VAGGIGARVALPPALDPFGEDLGTAFIVSGPAPPPEGAEVLGQVGGESLEVEGLLDVAVSELSDAHARGLAELLG
jgi:phosphoribosylformylglycinamidine synthase